MKKLAIFVLLLGLAIAYTPASYSFVITIPRGTQTNTLYFNATQPTNWINPCTSIDLTGCQTNSVSIFRFWNSGDSNEEWNILTDSPPPGWVLFGNSTHNSTLSVFSTIWTVDKSIPSAKWIDAWLWANVTAG